MKILKTPSVFIIVLVLLISCSFSTTQTGSAQQKPVKQETVQVTTKVKIDTAKYVAVKRPTPAESAKRDSLLKTYIGSIVKPYVDDLKQYNDKNSTLLLDIIKTQNSRLDSLGTQRLTEGRLFEINSITRDSATQALIKSNKSNDSLKTLIINLDKRYSDFTSSLSEIFNNIKLFATVMGAIMLIFLVTIGVLHLIIIYKRSRTKLKYNV